MNYRQIPIPEPLYESIQKYAESHFTATSVEDLVLYLCRSELEKDGDLMDRIRERLQEESEA
jgi:hypothetical protein